MPESEYKNYQLWNGEEVTLDKDDKKYKAKAWIWDASQNDIWQFVGKNKDRNAEQFGTNEKYETYPEQMRALNDYLVSEIPKFIRIGEEEKNPIQLLDLQAFEKVIGGLKKFNYYEKTFEKISKGKFLHVKFALFDNSSYSKRFAKFWDGEVVLKNGATITSPIIAYDERNGVATAAADTDDVVITGERFQGVTIAEQRPYTRIEVSVSTDNNSKTKVRGEQTIKKWQNWANDEERRVIENLINEAETGNEELQPLQKKHRRLNFNEAVSNKAITRLANQQGWLESNGVGFYLELMNKRNEKFQTDGNYKGRELLDCYFFPVHFYENMHRGGGYNFHAAEDTVKHVRDVFERKMLFVIVNIGDTHWTLVVVNFIDKRFEYFDSLEGDGSKHVNDVRRWLMDHHFHTKKGEWDTNSWTYHSWKKSDGAPVQNDAWNCGIYALQTANYYAQDGELDFNTSHMPKFRDMMLVEIFNGEMF